MWTLAFGYHEDRTPTHGYEPTREAAMAAFARAGDGSDLNDVRSWGVKRTSDETAACFGPPLLTRSGHRRDRNPAMQQSPGSGGQSKIQNN